MDSERDAYSCPHTHQHQPHHAQSCMLQQNKMSGIEGDPSATSSSGEAGSATATTSCVEAEPAASPAPNDSVYKSELQLQPPPTKAETTITGSGDRRIAVTLEPPVSGKRKLTAWCWRFVSRFTPTINDKNVVCLVKKVDGTTCNHIMKWTPGEGKKKGTGTSGITTHIQNKHPTQYKEAMGWIGEAGSTGAKKAPVSAVIGEW